MTGFYIHAQRSHRWNPGHVHVEVSAGAPSFCVSDDVLADGGLARRLGPYTSVMRPRGMPPHQGDVEKSDQWGRFNHQLVASPRRMMEPSP